MIAQRSPWLTAVALSMLVLPLAVLGLRAPLWLGVLIAVGALAAATLSMRGPARVTAQATAKLSVLEDAELARTALLEAAREVRDGRVRARLERIAARIRALVDHVSATPADLARVQRALAYYAPRAAALATSYGVMEDAGESARLPDVARVLARIDGYLAHSLDWLAGDARRALDIELKLIDDALDEDDPPARKE